MNTRPKLIGKGTPLALQDLPVETKDAIKQAWPVLFDKTLELAYATEIANGAIKVKSHQCTPL